MFEAMLNGRIDTGGMRFEPVFADIEELNRVALGGRAAICKVSCAVLPEIVKGYRVLDSGSALGRGNGPLLVCRRGDRERIAGGKGLKVAVPGMRTTARLLLGRFFPALGDPTPVLFSEVAPRVAHGEFDAGVLIHEGRFTYREHGLEVVADLGAEWEKESAGPLPLGCIVASGELPAEIRKKIGAILRESIRYALDNPQESMPFVLAHAQEMSPEVVKSHIALFVNEYSLSLGPEGRRAMSQLTRLDENTLFGNY